MTLNESLTILAQGVVQQGIAAYQHGTPMWIVLLAILGAGSLGWATIKKGAEILSLIVHVGLFVFYGGYVFLRWYRNHMVKVQT